MEKDEIVRLVAEAHLPGRTALVGLDGLGGSGKSSLASSLCEGLKALGIGTEMVHFDDFYLPSADRPPDVGDAKPVGGDFDWQRLRESVLAPLREGLRARYARYDWHRHALAETHEVTPGGVVLVEGVYCCRKELSGFYDLKIWVDCPRALRLERGIARDGESYRGQWEHDWMPAEDRYVAEHRPDQLADITVSGW